jgi:hypothetical protein
MRPRLARATDDHRNARGSWARLARAFQAACARAAARTRRRARPLRDAQTFRFSRLEKTLY